MPTPKRSLTDLEAMIPSAEIVKGKGLVVKNCTVLESHDPRFKIDHTGKRDSSKGLQKMMDAAAAQQSPHMIFGNILLKPRKKRPHKPTPNTRVSRNVERQLNRIAPHLKFSVRAREGGQRFTITCTESCRFRFYPDPYLEGWRYKVSTWLLWAFLKLNDQDKMEERLRRQLGDY